MELIDTMELINSEVFFNRQPDQFKREWFVALGSEGPHSTTRMYGSLGRKSDQDAMFGDAHEHQEFL